jgi:hypothetical protein
MRTTGYTFKKAGLLLGGIFVVAFVVTACGDTGASETPTGAPTSTDAATMGATFTAVGTDAGTGTATESMTEEGTPTAEVTGTVSMSETAPTSGTAEATGTGGGTGTQPVGGANSITVRDQALAADNTLTVAQVIASVQGWIDIHADDGGKPGVIVGFAPVKPGQNDNIKVPINDVAALTATAWAMLHIDAGTIGKMEFPNGPDVPVMTTEGAMVAKSFKVTNK